MTSRRDVLTVLGLTAGAGVVVSPDRLLATGAPVTTSRDFQLSAYVGALRRLADEVERGDVLVTDLEVTSRLEPDAPLVHTMRLKFLLLDQAHPGV